jgi:hypothetical protein
MIETEPGTKVNEEADYPLSCMSSITGCYVIE